MKEKKHWTEKPIPSLIISILGIGMIFSALLNLLGLVDEPIEKSLSIGGIIYGLILMYPIFKSKIVVTKHNSLNSDNLPIDKLTELPIWWKRLLGFLIDLIIIYLIMSTETMIYGTRYLDSLFIVTIFVYFFFSELIFQSTIGKSIFGLKVYNVKNGKKANIWQIFVRTAMRYFPLDFVSYFLKRPRGMKDEIAKTIVIKKLQTNEKNL